MAVVFLLLGLNLLGASPSPIESALENNPNAANGLSNGSTALSITDRNGADITSSFQVMVYSGQLPSNASDTGLADRQLTKITYINDCLPVDSFKESKCDIWRSRIGSLQAWTKTCYKFVTHYDQQGIPQSSSLQQYTRDGHCAMEEICVNTFGAPLAGKQGPQIAMCIAKSEFGSAMDGRKYGLKRILDAVLDSIRGNPSPKKLPKVDSSESGSDSRKGSSAAVTISQTDGQTPIEAKNLQFAAWSDAEEKSQGLSLHKKKCRMCSDIEMAQIDSNSDHLKLEASLLTAGAMAGMLWIAVMSG